MSQVVRQIIAKNVKFLREKTNLKREELSLALGFDNSYITIDKLEIIANFFNINIKHLFK